MDVDDLLFSYFGARNLEEVPPSAVQTGVERMRVDFGLEKDRGKRFALRCLLHMLRAAPDLDVAFAEVSDRDAARNFMDLIAASSDGECLDSDSIAHLVDSELWRDLDATSLVVSPTRAMP